MKVLYIAGTGRSGTTVLDRILGQLDGFFSAGELENIWHRGVLADRKCGCGVPFSRCPVWTAVLRRAFGGLDGVVASRMATLSRRHTEPQSIPATLAGGVGHTDPARFCTGRGWRRPVLLHLVRDPRATAYSFQQKKLPDFGDEGLMQQAPLVSSRRWVLWQDRSDRYLRVRYQDFMREPQRTVQRIAALVDEVPAELPVSSDATVRMQPTHFGVRHPNRFPTGRVEVRAMTSGFI